MEGFLNPLIGGILIGFSSTMMLWGLGRITGISGIYATIFNKDIAENYWKVFFIIGLIVGGIVMKVSMPELFNYEFPDKPVLVVIAGLLVGYGTRLGSGCTSGHGVCGMPRLSTRSILATATFMTTGIITVLIMGVMK